MNDEHRIGDSVAALKQFFRAQLPSSVASNRMSCTAVLFCLYANQTAMTIESLSEALQALEDDIGIIDQVECQNILNELAVARIVEKRDSDSYSLPEKIMVAAHEHHHSID